MAKNETIFFTKDGRFDSVTTASSATGTAITAGAEGSKLLMLKVTAIGAGSSINIDIDGHRVYTSGSMPTAGDDLLPLILGIPDDAKGNPYFNLPASALVEIQVVGSTCSAAAYVEDY